MNEILIYRGKFGHGIAGEPLVRKAAESWAADNGSGSELVEKIVKTPIVRINGRPEFQDLPFDFSISHSIDVWAILFSEERCGLDLQFFREQGGRLSQIADRFFPEQQRKFAKSSRADFFRVWTLREAMGKYTGKGVLDDLPDLIPEKDMEAELEGEWVELREIDLSLIRESDPELYECMRKTGASMTACLKKGTGPIKVRTLK
ncbi:MAG: 4'-phosphopantetheinyl transferase superfamily protein [Eubacteriales bacterium]|nr:4'-phosphopantetheinyl transferase superfamily protein [Eubacteriales bacterium]